MHGQAGFRGQFAQCRQGALADGQVAAQVGRQRQHPRAEAITIVAAFHQARGLQCIQVAVDGGAGKARVLQQRGDAHRFIGGQFAHQEQQFQCLVHGVFRGAGRVCRFSVRCGLGHAAVVILS